MKEKFKTGVLLILSLLTVFLASRIWFTFPTIEKAESVVDDRVFDMTFIHSDIVAPKEIIVSFGGDNQTVVYDVNAFGMWRNALPTIIDIFTKSGNEYNTTEITASEYYAVLNQEAVIFRFHDMINTNTLLSALGVKKPNKLSEDVPNLSKLYISTGEKNNIIFSSGDRYYAVHLNELEKKDLIGSVKALSNSNYNRYYPLNELHDVNNIVFVPNAKGFKANKIYFENIVDRLEEGQINNLVTRFLGKSIEYIREYHVDDKIMYIYKTKTLTLNNDGQIIYTDPFQSPQGEGNLFLSINTAMEFISDNIGFDRSLHLYDVSRIESKDGIGYRFGFGMIANGLLVDIVGEDISNYIEIEVYNNYVKSFVQMLRVVKDTGESEYDMSGALELSDIIRYNTSVFTEILRSKGVNIDYDDVELVYANVLESLQSTKIVYLDRVDVELDEPLELVWKIELFNKSYYFDIFTGNFIVER